MQQLLRRPMLAVADSPPVEGLIRRSGLAQGLVRRFVAGETLDEALTAVQGIAAQGMTSTLDQLGENVDSVDQARAAVGSYVAILHRMAAIGQEPNISVKLTMLGLDFGDEVAASGMTTVLDAAREVGGFVRIDMEGSAYTERTIALAESLHDRYPEQVGTVIQSYLRRSPGDVDRLLARGMRLRLVKGAYAEPESVAFRERREVDAAYVALMERLLDAAHRPSGPYPAIATHDPALIRATRGYALRMGITADCYEFQMLYGVRRDEQVALTAEGYRMRVYVPYGTEWYPYFTRRIAERPANALFVLRQFASG